MALTKFSTFQAAHNDKASQVIQSAMVIKGSGTDDFYLLEADPVSGLLPTSATVGGSAFDFGAVAGALRTASILGNVAGIADFGAGAVSVQTVRTTPASDSPHLLATRHEAAATPLSGRLSNGANFADFGAGAVGATTLRTTPASDSPHLLATRHEAEATPLAGRLSNGTNFADFGAGAVAATTLRTTPASDSPHLLATRHETVTTPLASRLSDGTDFIIAAAIAAAQSTIATAAKALLTNSLAFGWDGTNHKEILLDSAGRTKTARTTAAAVIPAEGVILGTSLTNAYATVLTMAANPGKILIIRNSCDKEVMVSLDNGATDHFSMDAGDSLIIDLDQADLYLTASSVIKAKYASVVPTTGKIKASVIF